MPRQVRIEYAGAFYHVMARGNRRGNIVFDDEDRKTFLRTLGEACKRAGFRIHAYALMSNHYHLLLETPQANLTAGMGWFQNAYTRRINTQHGLWGHLFGGRYKAIVVEPGNCYRAILDYIHLNPVRAGLVAGKDGMKSYAWSSLPLYLKEPSGRPEFLETAMGFEVSGFRDDTGGRKKFLLAMERNVDWGNTTKAGVGFSSEQSRPNLSLHVALRRGWFFGSQAFRENLMAKLRIKLEEGGRQSANGYHGPEIKDHGQAAAERLASAGCDYFEWKDEDLGDLPKGDERKALIASLIHRKTTVPLDWISKRLRMGVRAGVCRSIKRHRERLKTEADLERIEKEVMSRINA
jgi:REP element-mobilizing transposase RayT